MLRAAVLAAWLATAYCGAKGSPQPPSRDASDGGTPTPTSTPNPNKTPTRGPMPSPDAGAP